MINIYKICLRCTLYIIKIKKILVQEKNIKYNLVQLLKHLNIFIENEIQLFN